MDMIHIRILQIHLLSLIAEFEIIDVLLQSFSNDNRCATFSIEFFFV